MGLLGMCGIAGACGPGASQMQAEVRRMCDHMTPRGPDDGGLLVTAHGTELVLGARRLAIIDPSTSGHQPFLDEKRHNAIVYNGMLYNYRELRRELEARGETFTSDCDTEVVLKAFGVFGAECVHRLRGMFAFAAWNAKTNELLLVRDRFGIKPLYYSVGEGRLLFASQVKTLLASGAVPMRLSGRGVESFLSFGSVSDPLTIIEGVAALPAGHLATWSDDGLKVRKYWDIRDVPGQVSKREFETDLRDRLDASVARHLVSDAPLGVFLSGGLDSSVLAALASRHSDHLRAVSVSFAEEAHSEAPYQRLVADALGCEHVQIELSATELLDTSTAAFTAMDQPSMDAVNTYAVSKAASDSGLTVALSGLGADELFDGYGYTRRARALEAARLTPGGLRHLAAAGATSLLGRRRSVKASAWLNGELPRGSSYELLRRLFVPSEVAELRGGQDLEPTVAPSHVHPSRRLQGQIATNDLSNYMCHTLLRDTDAMSMAASLEVRVPFLDDEFAPWVVGHLKHGGRPTKAALSTAIGDDLPPEIGKRPKQGFALPIADWMRGPLREEVESMLTDPPEELRGHLVDSAARAVWEGFNDGTKGWTHPWALYALGRWLETAAGLGTRDRRQESSSQRFSSTFT